MICPRLIRSSLSAGLLAVCLCGCLPPGSDPAEEQKEPHYLAGKARVNGRDFQGAVESFEKAVEVNPRSASAHFELGCLYGGKTPDPAAAIYHYEKYLKLRPQADNAELVRQQISACKQDLAKAVLPLPVTPSLQREFEQLAEENRRLKDELTRWQAHAASLARAASNSSTPVLVMRRPDGSGGAPAPNVGGGAPVTKSAADGQSADPIVATPTRTHTIKAGESPFSVAKHYGVKLDALMAANPGINPQRLKVGQKLNIPSP